MPDRGIIQEYESTSVTVVESEGDYIVEQYDELLASFEAGKGSPRLEALAFAAGYHEAESNPLQNLTDE